MGRVKWRRVRLGVGRVYTMAYVDDVVMLVESEEMKSVIERLKQYLDRKKLETNRKDENYEIQEGRWKRREKRLEREGKGNSGNEGI